MFVTKDINLYDIDISTRFVYNISYCIDDNTYLVGLDDREIFTGILNS